MGQPGAQTQVYEELSAVLLRGVDCASKFKKELMMAQNESLNYMEGMNEEKEIEIKQKNVINDEDKLKKNNRKRSRRSTQKSLLEQRKKITVDLDKMNVHPRERKRTCCL